MNKVQVTEVQVPGTLVARVSHGRIIGYDFTAAANDAGYFGEPINVIEGPEVTEEEFWDMVARSLTYVRAGSSAMFSCEWSS